MSEHELPFTRSEVLEGRGCFPSRGLYCEKCRTTIPQFADFSDADQDRVLDLIRNGRTWMAIEELMDATGCDLRWAKIWVNHRGKPEVVYETPCSFCGMPLRSSESKQCRHCKRDWHDPDNVLILGTNEPFIES